MAVQRQPLVLVGVRDGRKTVRWRAVIGHTLAIALITGVGIAIAWALLRIFLGPAFVFFPFALIVAIGPAVLSIGIQLLRAWRQPMSQLPKLDEPPQ